MKATIVLSKKIEEKIDEIDYDNNLWTDIGINSKVSLISNILSKINKYNNKLNVSDIVFLKNTGQNNQSYGYILDEKDNKLAYIFVIPPGGVGRNVVAQSTMTASYIITSSILESNTYEITNIPTIVLYLNEDKIQKSKAQEIISVNILNFGFVDIFERDVFDELKKNNIFYNSYDIIKYDLLLKGIADGNLNNYFDIDVVNKIINFKIDTLGDASTNERYFYTLKNYPTIYLALRDNYKLNLKPLIDKNFNNETIKTFISYAIKLEQNINTMLQKIYYGAPGTGKSFKIDDMLKKEEISSEYIYRVTFHPEFTYSDFIGQLLPTIEDNNGEKTISYSFNKGVFTQSIEKAYQDTSIDVYLILEEMSRGDVAAIFGDIFQLLDREQNGPLKGFSKYFINNDIIARDITSIIDNKIKLPPNLNILGTVNTSDQNVFVMDTAFKRRFDWEYISTKPEKLTNDKYLNNVNISISDSNGNKVDFEWVIFFMSLNKFISHKQYLELGEDKQIGQFFIEFSSNDSADTIKTKIQNKLLQYLWNDIHKASFKRNIHLFSAEISSFSDLYDLFGDNKNVFSPEFIDCLKNMTL